MCIASRVYLVLILVAFAGLLTACGASSSPSGSALAATAVPTATATIADTPAATPLPTVDAASLPSTCTDIPYGSATQATQWLPLVKYGDLVLSQAAPGLWYPSYQLPDGTPLKPLQVPTSTGNPNPSAPPANPGGQYVLSVCNVSASQHHTVQNISVRLDAFSAYGGQLNAWNPCDSPYNTQTGTAGGGCGGGLAVNEYLQATFPADAAVGASVVAAQQSSANTTDPTKPFPPLPLKLAPGQSISIALGLKAPSTPGTYTFSIGVSVDDAAPLYISTTPAALYAPVARAWDGQACTTPAMKAQIPDSAMPTYYICPKS